MTLRGLGIELSEHTEQVAKWTRELTETRRHYHQLTGESPPRTPAEIRHWVAQVVPNQVALGRWPLTPKSRELSTDSKHLQRLTLVDNPTVKPLLALMGLEKLISNFGPKLAAAVEPETGRLHSSYNIAGTKAGRFSCSNPNLQQLPKAKAPDFRRCIVAAPGHVLVRGDWTQVEMRAAGWITGDAALTAVFADASRDLHTETAAAIAGIPVTEVTPEQRQSAKAVNYGSIYGIGARALAENAFTDYGVEMTEAEAARVLDRFFQTYPALARWRQVHADRCMQRRRIEIGCGRVVKAEWEIETKRHLTFNQCCNLPIQGICADAMLRALRLAYDRLRALKIRGGLVACIHDELLLEVHADDAEPAKEALRQVMTEAFVATFPGAPIANLVAVECSRSWADAK
jgi:DNA polymerase I-like protein with 3'-5' exonuclease and polymerase domains